MSENQHSPRIGPGGVGHESPDDPAGIEEGDAGNRPFEDPAPNSDHFTVTDFVGAGNTGRVYRAIDRKSNRVVALKFLHSDDPAEVRRFQREARSQAKIDHDHVCRIFDVGEVGGRPYIAMRFIDGRPLQDLAADLDLESKVRLMEQVARAAHAAHSIGIIHRDIKPTNVMVEMGENGGYHAYVLDFGIAREVDGPLLSMQGMAVGTPAYMAPEQIRGDPDLVDRRVDVYGIGATLYEVISGEAPFSGSTRIAILMQVLTEEPRPLRHLDLRIPVDLETIVSTCIEKDPQRRYASARALADDLRRYLAGERIVARRSGLVSRVSKFVRRLVG